MRLFGVYSGDIRIWKVEATTYSSASNKAFRKYKHRGLWIREI